MIVNVVGWGIPWLRWSIGWWRGLPDFGRNVVIIDHLSSRWGVCRGRRRRGAVAAGVETGVEAASVGLETPPHTRRPPRHHDTGTTTHLSALLPLPPPHPLPVPLSRVRDGDVTRGRRHQRHGSRSATAEQYGTDSASGVEQCWLSLHRLSVLARSRTEQ